MLLRRAHLYLGLFLIPRVLPDGGQHFFFDCGGGSLLAFFWWPDAPPEAPGIASVKAFPTEPKSAVGSMNHVAFDVPPEKIDEYLVALRDKGIDAADIMNHDDSRFGMSDEVHEGTFVRSIYFMDPDGILLEFAAWTRQLTEADVRHQPATAARSSSATS